MMNARHLIDVTYMFESVHRFCFEENEQRREEEPRAGLAYNYFCEVYDRPVSTDFTQQTSDTKFGRMLNQNTGVPSTPPLP